MCPDPWSQLLAFTSLATRWVAVFGWLFVSCPLCGSIAFTIKCLGSSWADDAVELAANVCNANPSACLLVMVPVTHSNVIPEAIIKKTRLVQDKIMMSPGLIHFDSCMHLSEFGKHCFASLWFDDYQFLRLWPCLECEALAAHPARYFFPGWWKPWKWQAQQEPSRLLALYFKFNQISWQIEWNQTKDSCFLGFIVNYDVIIFLSLGRPEGWLCFSKLHARNSIWLKSDVSRGVIGPVKRARIADLQKIDNDKPLSASDRESCRRINFGSILWSEVGRRVRF